MMVDQIHARFEMIVGRLASWAGTGGHIHPRPPSVDSLQCLIPNFTTVSLDSWRLSSVNLDWLHRGFTKLNNLFVQANAGPSDAGPSCYPNFWHPIPMDIKPKPIHTWDMHLLNSQWQWPLLMSFPIPQSNKFSHHFSWSGPQRIVAKAALAAMDAREVPQGWTGQRVREGRGGFSGQSMVKTHAPIGPIGFLY